MPRHHFEAAIAGVALLLAAALLGGCDRPSYAYRLRPGIVAAQDFAMPSGLRVVFRADATRTSVTLVSVIDAGVAADPPERPGLSALVAHASRWARVDGETLEQALERLGGATRTVVDRTRVTHITTVPTDALTDALRVEAVRLRDPLAGIDEAGWPQIRLLELRRVRAEDEADGARSTEDALWATLAPPGLPLAPAARVLAASGDVSLDEARALARARYRPPHTTLLVSGPIDPAGGRGLLVGGLPPELILADPAAPAPAAGPRVPDGAPQAPPPTYSSARLRAPVPQTRIVFGWRLPGRWHTSMPAWRAIAERLEVYLEASAQPRTQWEDAVRLVDDIRCAVRPGARASLLTCRMAVTSDVTDVDGLLERARGAAASLWQSKTEPPALLAARNRALGRIFADFGDEASAVDIAHSIHDRGVLDPYPARMRALSGLMVSDLRDMVHGHLDRERMAALVVEPGPLGAAPTATAPAGWPDAFGPAPWVEETFGPLETGRIASAARPPVEGVERFTLAQGVPLYVVRAADLPLARATLHLWGGENAAGPIDYGRWLETEERAEAPYRIMGAWTTARGPDAMTYGLDASPDNLDEMTHMLAEATTTRALDWRDWRWDERARLAAADARRRRADDPREAVADAMLEALYGARGLGRRHIDAKAVAALDEATLRGYLRRTYAPANSTVMVVGDVDPAEAHRQLDRRLGPWRSADPGTRLTALEPPPPPPEARTIVFHARTSDPFARIAVSCLLTADRAAGEVAGAALQREFDRVLRDAAGVRVAVETRHLANGNSTLALSATVPGDGLTPALRTLLGALETLGRGALPTAHLRRGQWSVAHRSQWASRTAAATTARLTDWLCEDDPVAAIAGWPRALAAVDAAAVAAALAPCAGREVIGIVGPPAALPGGFGPVRTLDASAP